MLRLLRQRNFFLLWVGQFISVIGDWVLFIALPFYTYSLTGSVLATGAMFIVSTLPRLVLGSVAGVFVDRWDRKRTMIMADLLRVVLILMLLVVRSQDWLWLIYVSSFLESVVSQFFNPAKSAIIPLLVGEKDLLPANSLNGLSDALTRLLGSALGGLLMGWLGLSSVVMLDAGSFLFSALMITLIVMPARLAMQPAETHAPVKGGFLGVWREWVAGLRLIKRDHLLLMLFIVLGVAFLGDSMITVLIVPLVKTLMGGGAQMLGWLMVAQGTGGLVGGLLMGQFVKNFSSRRISAIGLVITGIVIFAIISIPHSELVFPLMSIAGLAATIWIVSSETLLQLGTSNQFRGRIFGTLGTTSALASLVGMLLAGALADLVGLVPILCISGGLYILSGVLAWIILPKTLRFQPSQPITVEKEISPLQAPMN
ncbi:MAG: MFS transporter [Anaerolineales bacterium]|jgi:MFS family permease